MSLTEEFMKDMSDEPAKKHQRIISDITETPSPKKVAPPLKEVVPMKPPLLPLPLPKAPQGRAESEISELTARFNTSNDSSNLFKLSVENSLDYASNGSNQILITERSKLIESLCKSSDTLDYSDEEEEAKPEASPNALDLAASIGRPPSTNLEDSLEESGFGVDFREGGYLMKKFQMF